MKLPNFELANRLEKELEKIPVIKTEAHFQLNDIAEKMLQAKELSEEDTAFLELIWVELQGLDTDLIMFIDTYRSQGAISAYEAMISANYFLISEQVGPESKELRDAFRSLHIDETTFAELSKTISIPEHSRKIINEVFKKLKNQISARLA